MQLLVYVTNESVLGVGAQYACEDFIVDSEETIKPQTNDCKVLGGVEPSYKKVPRKRVII